MNITNFVKERLKITDILSSAVWKSEEIFERITEIKEELDVLDTMKNDIIAGNKLAKINLNAETPTINVCARISKH